MEKPIYIVKKEQKLSNYVQKFNDKKHTLNNGGYSERTPTNKHDSKG